MTTEPQLDLRDPDPFKDRLARELRDAALRLEHARETPPSRQRWFEFPRLPVIAVGALVLLLFVSALAVLRPGASEPAGADIFEVVRQGETVTITTRELISNPAAAETELDSKGIDAEVRAVPVSPSLVGHLVSAEAGFDDEDVEVSSGRVQAFTFTPDSSTPVVLEIGRRADTGEDFAFTWEPTVCEAVLAESDLTRQNAVASSLGYSTVSWLGDDGNWLTERSAQALLATGAQVIDVEPKSPGELVIVLSDDRTETLAPCS